MKIHGITVSVGYAHMLRKTLPHWRCGLDSISVITSSGEIDTIKACHPGKDQRLNVSAYCTNAFYENRCSFNKGAAISEFYRKLRPHTFADFVLLFDADVHPRFPCWRDLLNNSIEVGNLYGAPRFNESGQPFNDPDIAGYFMLFNASDPNATDANGNLVDICWPHAGNYDTTFHRRWPAEKKIILRDLPLVHYGPTAHNWFGIGNEHKVAEMNEERAKRGGWEHERMQLP